MTTCGALARHTAAGHYLHQSEYPLELSLHASSGVVLVQTRGGYTATEEYIMRAHAESTVQQQQRCCPVPLDMARRRDLGVNINVGVRGYRVQALAVAVGGGLATVLAS